MPTKTAVATADEPPPPPRTCLHQTHRLRTVRMADGEWVAGCSCAEYMSDGYLSAATAMYIASREHRMAPGLTAS